MHVGAPLYLPLKTNCARYVCKSLSLSVFSVVSVFSQMRLENMKAGRKGNLNVATEVMKPNFHCWECLDSTFNVSTSLSGIPSGAVTSYGGGQKS